ncbi:hypothetical protein GKZ89_08420 [Bacillus mangrovi]|uniref:Uncharacterized protein n=1 Tax=Metabacillus mangrovi TaxID=1491830 RepID=A0A7X2S561_9BACI|nr:hypothetical protein [Metabacillus mangrovi]MTH53440.1 hypothetical protein [Metabacillus mangrovi]
MNKSMKRLCLWLNNNRNRSALRGGFCLTLKEFGGIWLTESVYRRALAGKVQVIGIPGTARFQRSFMPLPGLDKFRPEQAIYVKIRERFFKEEGRL